MMLIGARPGQGKTILALEIALEAVKFGKRATFFTLEYTEDEVLERLISLGSEPSQLGSAFEFDCSDEICADYIIEKSRSAVEGTVIVIDYLQLLDQKREHPPLAEQIDALKSFANERGVVVLFISQISRSYDLSEKPSPDLSDVRLPNPVNLASFTKTYFVSDGAVHIGAAS
jgi:replicative DNA helicase